MGTKAPALMLADAKATVQKAKNAATLQYAALQLQKAEQALSEAELLWKENKGSSGFTGDSKTDDLIREKARYAMLHALIAQAIAGEMDTAEKIRKIQVETAKYEALREQYLSQAAQAQAILAKQQVLEAARREALRRAEEERRAREEALKKAALAEAAKAKALTEAAKLKEAEEAARRAKEAAELAKLKALQEKEAAEKAKLSVLQEKELAEKKLQEALRKKEEAEKALQEALRRAQEERAEMERKLKLLSAEFAKVRESKRGLVVTLSDILFEVDKAVIQPGAAKNLDYLASILKEYPDHKLLIEGHTDSTGPEDYNQALSEERAYAVMGYLISKGLDPEMMEARGYGETRPVASNATPEGRQQNRRVDIIILNKELSESAATEAVAIVP